MKFMFLCSLSLLGASACGSKLFQKDDDTTDTDVKPPLVVLPPPPTSPTTPSTPVSPAPESPAVVPATFLKQISGRWRVQQCLQTGVESSRAYALEFAETEWVSFVFNYPENPVCAGAATPNDGSPRVYSVKLEAAGSGWVRVTGGCSMTINNCTGTQSLLLKLEKNLLTVRKEKADSLWFADSTTTQTYVRYSDLSPTGNFSSTNDSESNVEDSGVN